MKLVADANVLFSAFIKGGLTRRLFLKLELELFAPEFIIQEFVKYSKELFSKSGFSRQENKYLQNELFSRLSIVRKEELKPYIEAAQYLVTDPDDAEYVACALAVGADLWSRDRHLKQPRVKCWSTEELARYLGYL